MMKQTAPKTVYVSHNWTRFAPETVSLLSLSFITFFLRYERRVTYHCPVFRWRVTGYCQGIHQTL